MQAEGNQIKTIVCSTWKSVIVIARRRKKPHLLYEKCKMLDKFFPYSGWKRYFCMQSFPLWPQVFDLGHCISVQLSLSVYAAKTFV